MCTRFEYRNSDLQCFLKCFCGPGTLLKRFSYDTEENYFLKECSCSTSVDVLSHHRNECNGDLFFFFIYQCFLDLTVIRGYDVLIKN